MKNFDQFSNSINLNESEIRFLNESETELKNLCDEFSTYMEDQGIKNPSCEVNGDVITVDLAGKMNIKKDGDKFIVSMEHNPDETVEDIYGWLASQVASYHAGAAEYKKDAEEGR